MKVKFNEFIETFKKIWADERGKALIKLGLYMLFAVFAVITAGATYRINNQNNENNKPVNAMEKYINLKNFSGDYIIGDNKYSFTSATKQIIKVGTFSYFVEDGKLVNAVDPTLESPVFEFKFWYLTPTFISDLIDNGEKSYTTTFSDESIESAYLIPLKYFTRNYTGTILPIENDSIFNNKNVEIITTEKDKEIVKVKINLSTYYTLIDSQVTNYNVEIDYK